MEKAKYIEVDITSGWKDAEDKINKILEELGEVEITARQLIPLSSRKAHVLIMYKTKKKFKE